MDCACGCSHRSRTCYLKGYEPCMVFRSTRLLYYVEPNLHWQELFLEFPDLKYQVMDLFQVE